MASCRLIDTPIPLNLNQSTNANLEVVAQSTDQSLFQNIKWLIGNKIQNANKIALDEIAKISSKR